MKMSGLERFRQPGAVCSALRRSGSLLLAAFLLILASPLAAQSVSGESIAQQMQQLNDAMARIQAQMDDSERALGEMRKQLMELQKEMAPGQPASAADQAASESSSGTASATLAAAVEDLREREAVTESELATHEQDKVESASKYPVHITGLILLNGFANRGAVDVPATPSLALPGVGSAGMSLRQTMVGIDAQGPHLFGARSYADLRADFYGGAGAGSGGGYSGYSGSTASMRLRTAHAGLEWDQLQAYFSLDRPIISPDTPSSLTAVAVPPLAWSGNLWTWNPQVGMNGYLRDIEARGVEFQAALIDAGDAPLTPQTGPSSLSGVPPSSAEQSSRPGVEARIAAIGSLRGQDRNDIGVGGYFAPHRSALGPRYDSWAATIDERVLLPARLQLTGNFYRGSALGGLGGGGYKDFAYQPDPDSTGYYFRALDDAGGWTQLKEKFSERLEFNGALGMDNLFAGELRPYFAPGASMAQKLARNRTYTGNVIYSPSAYLLFSFEYRRLESTPVSGAAAVSNIFGAAAGYKF